VVVWVFVDLGVAVAQESQCLLRLAIVVSRSFCSSYLLVLSARVLGGIAKVLLLH